MLMRPDHHSTSDLDAERRRIDRVASTAAAAADRHVLRLCGAVLIHVAEVHGADWQADRINARLCAAGRSDLVRTATARLHSPIDARMVDAVAAALTGAHRG